MTTATKILCAVLTQKGIPFIALDDERTALKIELPAGNHFVINNTLGLISNSDERLAKDKTYQYQLLKNSVLLPKTIAYHDPNSKYGPMDNLANNEAIIVDIQSHFALPFILKRNQGSEGNHVFKIEDYSEIESKLEEIFNQNSQYYDHIALAQEWIEPVAEYRVVTYKHEINIAYRKDLSEAEFIGNISPLHWKKAKAVPCTVAEQKVCAEFLKPLFTTWPLTYAGFDIIADQNQKLWLIEVNAAPAFALFVRDNGSEAVEKLYSQIVQDLSLK